MTPELVAFVERAEELRLYPYLDQVGLPTIGFGHRIPSIDHPAITQDDADRILAADLAKAEAAALALCPNLASEPRRLAALTDLCFNVGAGALEGSGVVRCMAIGDWTGAAVRFRRWDHARGADGTLHELPELKARRETGAEWIEDGG